MLNILPYVNSVPTLGEQVRGIRQDVANREQTETNTDIAKEELLDIIQSRPYRQRIQAAKAEDAELRLGVNQKYLEDLMLNKTEQAKNANDLARERLDIQRQFGEGQAEAELAATQNQADYYKNQLKMGPLNRDAKLADIAATKARTEAERQRQLAFEAELAKAKRQEEEAKQQKTMNTAYQILSNMNLDEPGAADRAIRMIHNTEGVQLGQGYMDMLRANPKGFLKSVVEPRVIAPDTIYRRETDRLSAQAKLDQIRARGEESRKTEKLKDALDEGELFQPKSADRKSAVENLSLDLAHEMFGDSSVVRQDSPKFDRTKYEEATEMANRIEQISKELATTEQEYYTIQRDYARQYAHIFNSALALTNDIEAAEEYTPKTLEELLSFNNELEGLYQQQGPVWRFKNIIEDMGPKAVDMQDSLRNQGLALGISPDVVNYLIGGAFLKIRELSKPESGG